MNKDVKHYLSIDIGGTQIKIALINGSGQILEKSSRMTPDNLSDFKTVLEEIISSYHETIRGVAFSCPGKVNTKNGQVEFGGALMYLHLFNFAEFVAEKFQLTATVINDGKAAALSELWLGNLKDIDNGVAIILGTGVGGGLIVDGQLVGGQHFQAGEFSFIATSDTDSSLEQIIGMKGSAVAMIEACATALDLEDKKDGRQVFEYINKKDQRVYSIFQSYCNIIAHLVYNIQAVLDMKRVVIGGGISSQPILIEEVKRQYDQILDNLGPLKFMISPVEIQACAFGNEANLLGALYQYLLNHEN